MNLKEEILADHSKAHALKIARYACISKKNFHALMQCFLSDEYRLAQRAAWSVAWAAKQNPSMIMPHAGDLVAQLKKSKPNIAVLRNALRVLQDIEIPKVFHGEVMDACFSLAATPGIPVAIKAFSLTTLHNLCRQYPEIKSELKMLIEDNMEHETAAFKSRGRKILLSLGSGR